MRSRLRRRLSRKSTVQLGPPHLGLACMKLTARGYHRVLRVARTLADLDGAEKIGRLHLAEALSYRALAEDLRRAA